MNSVYHAGELAVQRIAGVEHVAEQNGKTVRETIPKGAIPFLLNQTVVVVGSLDKNGRAWTSLITGAPGFAEAIDERTIRISERPVLHDPLVQNLQENENVGLLFIELKTRRRMRVNGKAAMNKDGHIFISTEQVYGNCPKYIQSRELVPNGGYQRIMKSEQRTFSLEENHKKLITEADTFFIATTSRNRDVDASHRGGNPGFVRVVDDRTLVFPDYFGNSMFNTLGNIYDNPTTGLLFLDFTSGHSLQLTGSSTINWDHNDIAMFPGAERLVEFQLDEAYFMENKSPLQWAFIEYSPANPK